MAPSPKTPITIPFCPFVVNRRGEKITGGLLFQQHSYLSGTNGFVRDPTKPGMVRRIAVSLRIAWDT